MPGLNDTQTILRFTKFDTPSSALSLASSALPNPGPGQVLVRIHASAINPSDVMNVEGRFPLTTIPTNGRVPGRDFAGIVVSGPEKYVGHKIWDNGGNGGFTRDGSHEEYIIAEEKDLPNMIMPEGMTFPQAAASGVGFLTASMMVEKAAPKVGEHVLVLGSSGSVGSAAKQIVRLAGGIAIETSRKGEAGMLDITKDLEPQIEHLTGGRGLVAVLDTVGEASLFKRSLETLSPGGRYVFISVAKTPDHQFTFDAFLFYRKKLSIIGINTADVTFDDSIHHVERLKKGFEDGVLTPPALIEETELQDEKGVIAAYEKVKAGSRAKQVLVNKNL